MKFKSILSILFYSGLVMFLISSCNKQELVDETEYQIFLKTDKGIIPIQSEDVLNDYLIAKAPHTNINVQSVSIETLIDEEGEFKAIKGKYITAKDQFVNIVIPLKEGKKKNSGGASIIYMSGGCTMTCSPKNGCGGCDQTITRACKSQVCNCNQFTNIPGQEGACDSSIKFNDDE